MLNGSKLSSQHSSHCTHAHNADWKHTPLLDMRPHELRGTVREEGLHLWLGLFMDGNETEMKFHFRCMKSPTFCEGGPFVETHIFQPLSTVSRRRVSFLASAAGNVTQVLLAQRCQDLFRQYQGSQPRPSSSPGASHPLQLMFPLHANDISPRTETQRAVGWGERPPFKFVELVPALIKAPRPTLQNHPEDFSQGKLPT